MRENDDDLVKPGLADCRSGLVERVNGMIQMIFAGHRIDLWKEVYGSFMNHCQMNDCLSEWGIVVKMPQVKR